MEDDTSERRPKRQKRDSSYKSKAFEKFKQIKEGARSKYDVGEIENVFEVVDEKEYTKKVLARQDDDWIVDDDGSGYFEDGRDIFDDDLDKESIAAASTSKTGLSKGTKRKKASLSETAVKGNLKYLLSNMPNKKKDEQKLDEDAALSEILGEIDASPAPAPKPAPISSKMASKLLEVGYLKRFSPKLGAKKVEKHDLSTKIVEKEADVEEVAIEAAEVEEKGPEGAEMDVFDDDLDLSLVDVKIDEKIDRIWENIEDEMATNWAPNGTVEADVENEEIVDGVVGDGSKFRFFWWDAFEDVSKQPGVVFLFGKAFDEQRKAYVSCCVPVRNVERRLFFLPRKMERGSDRVVTSQDVYKEINEKIMKNLNVKQFKARPITKKYAFDVEVPAESDYIEVRYSAKEPLLDRETSGRTFSRIFGTESTYLEILLLDRKIKGPCWLEITNPTLETNPISWCKIEMSCTKPTQLSIVTDVTDRPPLCVAAINLRRAINPKTLTNEIVMISCVANRAYHVDKQALKAPPKDHFCVFTPPAGQVLPGTLYAKLKDFTQTKLQKVDSERALLNYFAHRSLELDADVIVGHDLLGYQINIICDRLAHHKITNFDKFGRLKRTILHKPKLERDLFVGRLVCDVKISAKELIKSKSYDLDALCRCVLQMQDGRRIDLEPEDVAKMFQSADELIKLAMLTMQDTANILKIMYVLNVVPLALQITNIAGNVMSRTLLGGRSERNEYLLLHAFAEKGYIVPDRAPKKRDVNVKKKAAYSGGLVLDPKVGFYDRFILLMDFNSLYPSIIQEYNICFTTMPPNLTETNLILPDKSLPYGILPIEIRKLVESRRDVKKLMQNPALSADVRATYNIRQMALKLTANSMYGCLGFTNSRFYARNLAALITHKGREILTNTHDLVQRMHYDVIYGDTDSLMINTNCVDFEQVYKIGKEIKIEINKLYRQVELDIDGVFQYLLLLKKKKYAAVVVSRGKDGGLVTSLEYKGLDVVRRDWSALASEAGKFVVAQILSAQAPDERTAAILSHLRQLRNDLNEGKVPLSMLTITKQLTKNPSLYGDAHAQAHVTVALRANKNGGHFRAGDTISYVVCCDGSDNSATQRAYLIDELRTNDALKIDVGYYLSAQILPVVGRICEPIEELDAFLLAECLGVENKGRRVGVASGGGVELGANVVQPEVKFANVERFVFECGVCGGGNRVEGAVRNGGGLVLGKCEVCDAKPVDYLVAVKNQMVRWMNEWVRRYYAYEMECEDPMCGGGEVVAMPMEFSGRFPVCRACGSGGMVKKCTERELYLQLAYLSWAWDLSKVAKKPIMEARVESAYQALKDLVDSRLKFCGYSIVNLGKLFDTFTVTKVDKKEIEVLP